MGEAGGPDDLPRADEVGAVLSDESRLLRPTVITKLVKLPSGANRMGILGGLIAMLATTSSVTALMLYRCRIGN